MTAHAPRCVRPDELCEAGRWVHVHPTSFRCVNATLVVCCELPVCCNTALSAAMAQCDADAIRADHRNVVWERGTGRGVEAVIGLCV